METRKELEHARQWKGQFESTQVKVLELELQIKELKEELNTANTAIVEKEEGLKKVRTT